METPNAMTSTQFLLVCTLFILLLIWMCVFAYLALRRAPEQKVIIEDAPSSSAIPTTPVPLMHVITPVASHKESNRQVVLEQSLR